jgi:hypothetical protein
MGYGGLLGTFLITAEAIFIKGHKTYFEANV